MSTRFCRLCHKIEIQFLNQLFLVECVWSCSWILIRNVNTLKLFNFHNSTTAYLRWPWSNNGEIHLTFVFNLKVWQKSRFHVRTLACIQTQAVVFSLPQDIWLMMISTPLNDVNIIIHHPFRCIDILYIVLHTYIEGISAEVGILVFDYSTLF